MALDMKTQLPMRAPSLFETYGRHRYTILFYSMFLLLVTMPIVTTLGWSGLLVRLQVGTCLVAAVMPSATRRTWWAFLAAVTLLVLAEILPVQGKPSSAPAIMLGLTALTFLLVAAGALRFAVTRTNVTSETVHAALSTYLLAGIAFGEVYWLAEIVHPGSLTGPDPFSEANAVYYSFVTLATLGYGDFLPRTAITRGIATFEVIGGQLFLAVLVSRLIGAFGTQTDEP
jgi:voltage-gated potassium channel